MPIQAPQWTDYLNCPVCCREFGPPPRSPISLGCGHTLCGHCLKHLHRKQCPFDQTVIHAEPEELVVNTALLQLAGYTPPAQPYHPPCIQALSEHDRHAYDVIVRCLEHLAIYLKLCGNANNSTAGNRLSRPMQRKLVTLLQCAITDEEGRGRAARAARSLGERTVTELILQHQNPQQLSANLWAAVRARGCQFLGPAMQEEVLKLVLLALEDGSALSRKVLVMFVVQRLEPHFPQASKTSIGHVVQLLYRASCFKVSKRECDSSLMQLKEEFRTYELLRREHDAQIVQIATEAGLRIAPDQWSALLYGDTAHKSHMQSIIDKLQTPQSFAQSVQELFIALQRTGDPAQLVVISMHLDRLANIDASPDAKSPTWQQLAEMIKAIKEVVSGLIHYLQQQASGRDSNHNQKHILQERCIEPSTSQPSPQTATTPTHKYKTAMCRDAVTRSYCPRGNSCTFAHYEEELERYRALPNTNQAITNGNYTYMPPLPPALPLQQLPQPLPLPQMYQRFPMPPPQPLAQHPHIDNYNVQSITTLPTQPMPQELLTNQEYGADNQRADCIQQPQNYASALMHNQAQLGINQNSMIVPIPDRPYYGRYGVVAMHDEPSNNIQFPRQEFVNPVFQGATNTGPITGYPNQEQTMPPPMPNMFVPVQHEAPRNISPYTFDDPIPSELLPDYRVEASAFAVVPRDRRIEPSWPTNSVFNFDSMRNTLPHGPSTPEDIFAVPSDRRAVGADRLGAVAERMAAVTSELAIRADDEELEEELQALERRIDTEFKSTD
ncbi:roquin-1 isoform X1 [Vanessa atalanta]|uniref:roquin-1 isoform X1 n=1 Tax=Vanessa atalanta TaxID=42275 RepID=UPI001FCD146F|nr:roquin-1 isoform X1 [Vanessa atalanta]XP_047543958.1 roquin-1 isoform X1 [Vanessa atalanta]XP_047543959.1 roquin-1 isoform X1 [Vanessa atalanta]